MAAIEVINDDGRRARMSPARLAAKAGDGWKPAAEASKPKRARKFTEAPASSAGEPGAPTSPVDINPTGTLPEIKET